MTRIFCDKTGKVIRTDPGTRPRSAGIDLDEPMPAKVRLVETIDLTQPAPPATTRKPKQRK